jgi:hypothetical protein
MQQLQMENKLRKQASKQASKPDCQAECASNLTAFPFGENLLAFASTPNPFLRPP